jgi:LPS-assembly protein
MAAYGTRNANKDGIPNEDSLLFESDESNVFEPNSVTNYDLWEGGGRVALGLSATARFGEGYELSGLVGRRWREEADPAFNAVSNLSGEKSDYVASVKGDLGQYFRTTARARLDDNMNISRLDLEARSDVWRLHGDARYFKVTSQTAGVPDQEGIVLGGNVKVTKNWSALFYQTRNIVLKRDIRLALGVAYRDECSYFAITYEHSGAIDRSLGQSDSIHFTFALTGLGAVSDDRFD